MPHSRPPYVTLLIAAVLTAGADGPEPADRLPAPTAERCKGALSQPDDHGMVTYEGLTYDQVKPPLQAALGAAAWCPQPRGMTEVHATFEILVGCDGLVMAVETSDDGGASPEWLECLLSVLRKADFPGHDMTDGFPITYPVNAVW